MRRREFLPLLAAALQEPQETTVDWVCPMDPDVRSKTAGQCPRCGMKLVPGLAGSIEYPLHMTVTPEAWRPGQKIRMRFEVLDPKTGRRCRKFQVVHEKLFHLFVVSGDLEYFAHDHPEPQRDGTFVFDTSLPKKGFYRVAGDFYPDGGTPQLAVKSLYSPGSPLQSLAAPVLHADLSPKQGANTRVELQTEPAEPIAGLKTMLFYTLSPGTGIEPYLGAWGHLLAGSADLIDLIHTHPFLAGGGPKIQFNIVFPRPGVYRLWTQFQRLGVVNTTVFNISVKGL